MGDPAAGGDAEELDAEPGDRSAGEGMGSFTSPTSDNDGRALEPSLSADILREDNIKDRAKSLGSSSRVCQAPMMPTPQFSSVESAVVKPLVTARSLNGAYDVINLIMRLQSLSAPRRNQRAKRAKTC